MTKINTEKKINRGRGTEKRRKRNKGKNLKKKKEIEGLEIIQQVKHLTCN